MIGSCCATPASRRRCSRWARILAHGGAQMMTEGLARNQANASQGRRAPRSRRPGQAPLLVDGLRRLQGSLWDIAPLQQRIWSRSFARAVAGTPINMTFDVESAAFEFCYYRREIQAPTEISLRANTTTPAARKSRTRATCACRRKRARSLRWPAGVEAEGGAGEGCVRLAPRRGADAVAGGAQA